MSVVLPSHPLHIKCIVLGSAGCGKTSILRRLFFNTFNPTRSSTVGSDWYTRQLENPYYFAQRLSVPTDTSMRKNKGKRSSDTSGQETRKRTETKSFHEYGPESESTKSRERRSTGNLSPGRRKKKNTASYSDGSFISQKDVPYDIQMREHIVLQMWDTAGLEKTVSANKTNGLTSNFGDNFFRHTDVAILVYDATSSRSFTQLIQWYSDLLERVKKIHETSNPTEFRSKHFPVLIVANKLDQLQKERSSKIPPNVPQRDVMGLHHHFNGDDSRYEYTVSTVSHISATGAAKKLSKRKNGDHTQALSYSLEGASWTSDHSYLDSIITSEDGSFPDRDLVLLWCRRNGLKHLEVSALDGTGVNRIMTCVAQLVVESIIKSRNEELLANKYSYDDEDSKPGPASLELNDRYRGADDCRLFKCFCPIWK